MNANKPKVFEGDKSRMAKIRHSRIAIQNWLCVIAALCLCVEGSLANPTGMTVATGTASSSQNGSQLTITTSPFAALNWQSFNIAAGETTIFNQPSASSVVLNRINDPNPSQIFGTLQANGIVVLMNAAGIYFGPNSYVHTGGLIVSTANCIPPPPGGGGSWQFNGPPPLSSIVNFGRIDVAPGGPAYLIAENVLNYGTINAPGGNVGLAAGQQVILSQRPDGRGLSMAVNLPDGSVDNEGHIIADAGTIALNARTINQNGFVQANSVRDVNGTIELVASDNLSLGANSRISANGDGSTGGSTGGNVTLQSGNTFSDSTGSRIDATGGSQGGNGGNVEISAPSIAAINTRINGQAQTGWLGGTLLLDPDYIVLDQSGSDTLNVSGSSGSILAGDSPGSTLYLNVGNSGDNFLDSAFLGLSQITLQAKKDITLAAGTSWSLSDSTGQTAGQLLLEAGNSIIFGDGSSIFDANNWSLTLDAGVNNFATGAVSPGVGNIYLNGGDGLTGGGSIQMAAGNGVSAAINLVAGQDITVGSGHVITTGGGSISAHALAGNIDTGSDGQGYHFESAVSSLDQAYDLSGGLGGISTAGGGDVTLIAGGDVTSVLPTAGGYIYDGNFVSPNNSDYTTAGAGAFGVAPGNVNIVAGGNVTGHYLVANGTGSINAGVPMDANGNPVTDLSGNYVLGTSGSAGTSRSNPDFSLSVINGGWNVRAAHDIILQEVNNPNGVFDTSAGASFNHYFDYGLDDFVNLSAGNLVQLGASASALPRAGGIKIPFIYPSILNITAGDGGVDLVGDNAPFNQLILFPSAQGSLTINTTGSLMGSLPTIGAGNAPQIFNLIVSDSGSRQYRSGSSFGLNDHAATPVHQGSETPVVLNIGGDMDDILLGSPEAAHITVGGDMNNCGFQGMNLAAGDLTSINVTGDIFDRGNFTSVDLSGIAGAQGIDLSVLADAITLPGQPSATTLAGSFVYDSTTKVLTYENIPGMTLAAVLNLLNNLTVQEVVNGVPQWEDPPFDTMPLPADNPVSVLGDPSQPDTAAYALLNQFNQLGAVPNNASAMGFFIGGGGAFDITARSMDLGTSAGIVSKGAGLYKVGGNYPLASLFGVDGVFDRGADISVTTTGDHSAGTTMSGEPVGDLDLFSSSIASLNGGNVSIAAGGDVNAGSSVLAVNSLGVRGIYSTAQGDVSVVANGNVNLNGSRIATYDGGDVTVESLFGDINAGTGASVPVAVQAFYEDPVTHAVYSANPQIPFSGILALTFPARTAAYPAPPAVLGNIFVDAPYGNVNANVAGILQIPLNLMTYPDATTTVLAGYQLDNHGQPVFAVGSRNVVTFGAMFQVDNHGQMVSLTPLLDAGGVPVLDAAGRQIYVENLGAKGGALVTYGLVNGKASINSYLDIGGDPVNVVSLAGTDDGLGNPLFVIGRNIDVNGSGLIASNAKLLATGNINGLIFARNNLDINSQSAVDVTALAIGNANVSGQSVIGTITGVGGISVSGDSITANLISANVSGATSGQSGLGQGGAANGASQALANNDSVQAAAASNESDDDEKKKKGKPIALARKVSRVTVILPPRKVSETKNSTPGI